MAPFSTNIGLTRGLILRARTTADLAVTAAESPDIGTAIRVCRCQQKGIRSSSGKHRNARCRVEAGGSRAVERARRSFVCRIRREIRFLSDSCVSQVGFHLGFMATFAISGKLRNCNSCKDADDGNYDEQLYQCKARFTLSQSLHLNVPFLLMCFPAVFFWATWDNSRVIVAKPAI